MSEYVIDNRFAPDAVIGVTPKNEFQFSSGDDEVLRLDEKGFHYKGQTIDDAGEAHRLFTNFMKKAMGGSNDI